MVCECCGVEGYVRYMDDFLCIHHDKLYLQLVQAVIYDKCAAMGLTINGRKTQIVKLSKGFNFLKKRFSYSDTGKVVVRPCRKTSITRERRKLKKQAALVAQGLMTYEQWMQSYQSWRGSVENLDAHRTLLEMDALFARLSKWIALRGDPPPANLTNKTILVRNPSFRGVFYFPKHGVST